MADLDRIAELEARLAQANVRLTASRALYQEASERLQDANAERAKFQHLALSMADLLMGYVRLNRGRIRVPRQDLMLAKYHLGHAMNTDAQDLAERFDELLEEPAASTAAERGNAHES